MNIVDILKIHGINISEENKVQRFRTSIRNALGEYGDVSVELKYVFQICQSIGYTYDGFTKSDIGFIDAKTFLTSILCLDEIYERNAHDDFVELLSRISIVLQNKHFSQKQYKPIIDTIKAGLNNFNLPYIISEGIIIPKGEAFLDESLVITVLEFLKRYPNAYSMYKDGLSQYYESNPLVADTMRKSLEIFLQEFLNNEANLATNIPRIGAYLKEQGIHEDLTNMLTTLISYYKSYNDKKDKHRELSDPKLWEFLIYQTGVFIRMLHIVKNTDSKTG